MRTDTPREPEVMEMNEARRRFFAFVNSDDFWVIPIISEMAQTFCSTAGRLYYEGMPYSAAGMQFVMRDQDVMIVFLRKEPMPGPKFAELAMQFDLPGQYPTLEDDNTAFFCGGDDAIEILAQGKFIGYLMAWMDCAPEEDKLCSEVDDAWLD